MISNLLLAFGLGALAGAFSEQLYDLGREAYHRLRGTYFEVDMGNGRVIRGCGLTQAEAEATIRSNPTLRQLYELLE